MHGGGKHVPLRVQIPHGHSLNVKRSTLYQIKFRDASTGGRKLEVHAIRVDIGGNI